jgi:hypothetical protein
VDRIPVTGEFLRQGMIEMFLVLHSTLLRKPIPGSKRLAIDLQQIVKLKPLSTRMPSVERS